MNRLIPVLLLLACMLLAGCSPSGLISITGQLPAINSFNASPSSISAGQSSELDWTVTGATSVSIDQGIGNVALSGTRAVSPATTTVYTLTASNSAGSVTATTQVAVSGATSPPTTAGFPVISSFAASPSTISLGTFTTLSWNVSNATSVSINQGVGTVGSSGSIVVSPSTTLTYTLTASNANGSQTATALVQVVGVPYPASLPVIDYFTTSPPIIYPGGASFLRWSTTNATSVTIDNGVGPVDLHGTMTVSPAYSTYYTLTATNAYGSQSLSRLIEVYGSSSPTTFYVTDVTAYASPPSYSGPCPYQFNFAATITVNGPGMVTYQWERSDGTSDAPQSVVFPSAGSSTVTTYWYLGAPGTGWERVRILSPNSAVSNEAYFILNCL
jgi:hypothetical protein